MARPTSPVRLLLLGVVTATAAAALHRYLRGPREVPDAEASADSLTLTEARIVGIVETDEYWVVHLAGRGRRVLLSAVGTYLQRGQVAPSIEVAAEALAGSQRQLLRTWFDDGAALAVHINADLADGDAVIRSFRITDEDGTTLHGDADTVTP